jgi:hypothetical protein
MNGEPQLPGGFDPRDLSSFSEIGAQVEEFERILRRYGLEIAPGSSLEDMALSLIDLVRKRKEPHTLDPMRDIRIDYRPALGLHDLMRKVVDLQNDPSFPSFIGHLGLLNKGTVAQNIVARTDQNSRKIFELLIGLIAAKVGTDVKMDPIKNSKGDNPDVLVTINGVRWGFACKVLSGDSPLTLFERLEEGIRQIRDSEAEKGCVVFNLKNKIDHDKTWPLVNEAEYRGGQEPEFGAWRQKEAPAEILLELGCQQQEELIRVNSNAQTAALFAGQRTIPGALLFLQTATSVQTLDVPPRPMMTTLGVFMLMDLFGVSAADKATLDRFNDAMHHR